MLFLMSWRWGHPEMARWSFPVGAVVASGGLLLRMWASAWLIKNKELITQGPYSLTRNPLYLGSGLITLGHGLMSAVPVAPVLFPALWLALYWPTMRQEEDYLAMLYGIEYEAYRQRVPLLVPWPCLTRDKGDRVRASDSAASDSATRAATQRFSWHRMSYYHKGFIANLLVIVLYGMLSAARSTPAKERPTATNLMHYWQLAIVETVSTIH